MSSANETWKTYKLDSHWKSVLAQLGPVLSAAETRAISERRFPIEAIDAMMDAGLFRLALAEEAGGLGLDPVTEIEIYEGIARISVSAAWNLVVGNMHTGWASAYLSDAAVAEIFPSGHRSVVAGQAAPTGRGVKVDGGVRVTGKYSWGSGFNHANWVMGGFTVDGGPPLVFVTPKSSAVCLDNWHVVGIEGSGSFDFAVEDAFIPDGFHYPFWQAPPFRGGARFKPPFIVQSAVPHSVISLGGAEHAMEAIARLAVSKKRALTSSPMSERGALLRDVGKAYMSLASARDQLAMAAQDIRAIQDWSDINVARYAAMAAHSCTLAVEVANMAFRYGGGDSVRLEAPLQRVLRDVLVAQQHVAVSDQSFDQFGAALIRQISAN